MANYNTFIVMECGARKACLVTSSARKAAHALTKGVRIDVWSDNEFVESVYSNTNGMAKYTSAEKQYIREKQERAQMRNARR